MALARPLVAVSLALASLAALPAAASAEAPACTYDEATHALSVSSPAEVFGTTVGRDGESIVVRDYKGPIACAGGAPTVTNTDTIKMTGAGTNGLTLDLSGGPMAPGFSAEEAGDPEIEIEVDAGSYYAFVAVQGSPEREIWQAGATAGITHVNLNADEAVADADVVVRRFWHLSLRPAGGDDVIDARGGAGTGTKLLKDLMVFAGDGEDTVYGGKGWDGLYGEGDGDTLHAGNTGGVNAYLTGGPGDDTLIAGAGPNNISPGLGDDTVSGLDAGGRDSIDFEYETYDVRVDALMREPQDTGEGIDTFDGLFEHIVGTAGVDVLRGGPGSETLVGGPGDDVLQGRGGNDLLMAGDGKDTVEYGDAGAAVTVDLDKQWNPQPTGGAGDDELEYVEHVTGSPFDDTLKGNALGNRLDGGGGADTLAGKNGDDTLVPGDGAGGGSDGGADTVDGGKGKDTLSYAGRRQAVAVRFENARSEGADPNGDGFSTAEEEGDMATTIENAVGGSGPDRFRGFGSVGNGFSGGAGNDWIHGSPGPDVLDGGYGTDTVSYLGRRGGVAVRFDGIRNDGADPNGDGFSAEGEERDHAMGFENAVGGSGPDTLVAIWSGVNELTGGPGADFINVLDGSSAADKVLCGTGTDTFRTDAGDSAQGCETAVP